MRWVSLVSTVALLIIFFLPFWAVLRLRLSLFLPYVIALVLLLSTVRVVGLSPLGFFVSVGGWLYLFPLSWMAALLVRVLWPVRPGQMNGPLT